MKTVGWKNEKHWAGYYKKMSNQELVKTIKDHKSSPQFYRGTVLVKVANKELARRKAAGEIRKTAGKPRSTGYSGVFGRMPSLKW